MELIKIYILLMVILLLIVFAIKGVNSFIKARTKRLTIIYYIIITTVFIIGRQHIHKKYQMSDGPVIPEGWEINSSWTSIFSIVFMFPLTIFVFYGIIQASKSMEKRRWLYLVITLSVSGLILFALFILFNLVYGLRP